MVLTISAGMVERLKDTWASTPKLETSQPTTATTMGLRTGAMQTSARSTREWSLIGVGGMCLAGVMMRVPIPPTATAPRMITSALSNGGIAFSPICYSVSAWYSLLSSQFAMDFVYRNRSCLSLSAPAVSTDSWRVGGFSGQVSVRKMYADISVLNDTLSDEDSGVTKATEGRLRETKLELKLKAAFPVS